MADESSGGPDRDESEDAPHRELSRCQRDIAVIGWSSFLVAAVGTMFFFAFVDPLALADITEPPLRVSRMTGYALGFFCIWAVGAAAATLTVYLIRTRHGHPPSAN